jgi:hypothetical protein
VTPGLPARILGAAGRRLAGAAQGTGRAWARRPTARRLAALALAAALVAFSAGGLAFQAALPSLLPSALDWRATAVLIERDGRPGDALIASPAWAERLRMVAPRRLRVLALPRFTPADLEGVRRVWLVSLTAAPGFSWQPELDLLARSAVPDPPLPVGRIQIARYELAHPDLPLATLAERLSGATATLGGQPCAAERGGLRCTGARSQAELTSGVVEVNGLPRPCLLVKMTGEAAPVRVTFPGVPVGRAVRGNAGLASEGQAEASLPLTVAVRVDGEETAAVQLEGAAWPTFRVDTARWAGERHTLSLEVVVPGDRAICLQAVTLP